MDSSQTGKTILIVEDEVDLRRMIAEYLESAGYNILQAGDGKQASDIFTESKPELILSDLRMPVMDGLQFLKYVKELSLDTPVILMSGYIPTSEEQKGISGLADIYMKKPFSMRLLLQVISGVEDGNFTGNEFHF